MKLVRAQLTHFRNFSQAIVEPQAQISALVGPNGQGKTNAIEALYLASALRPLRPVPRKALIQSGHKTASIHLEVTHQKTGLTYELEVRLEGGRRTLLRDQKAVNAPDFLGFLVAVAFTPDDLQLAKGGPDGRRRFLDRALLNSRPAYLTLALRYARAMKDRNRLLSSNAPDDEIDVFDSLLARDGSQIVALREAFVGRIAEAVSQRFEAIAQPAPDLTVRYASTIPDGPESLEDRLRSALKLRRPRDRKRGTTSVGPHVDDLVLALGDGTARERASQGQHRALVLALKLVEIEDLTSTLGEAPILLLDDMSSELDADRTRQLFDVVDRLAGQAILTSTSSPATLLGLMGEGRTLGVQRVEQGVLSEASVFESG